MKKICKLILKFYLKLIAKLVLAIHRPKIIAVAGSVNKTFVRDEIKKVLEKLDKSVRSNPRNFNTEIGLPLAILGLSSGYNSFQEWWPIIGAAFRAIFQKNFPEYLVLELGVSRSGDMQYLLSIVRPEISVVTDITQRYLESFPTMNDLVAEYIVLAKKTKKNGAVILNHDNGRVKELAKKSLAPVSYFGETIENKNDWKIGKSEKTETGQIVEIGHDEKMKKITLLRFGRHHAYALAASLAVEDLIDKK